MPVRKRRLNNRGSQGRHSLRSQPLKRVTAIARNDKGRLPIVYVRVKR